MPSIDLWRETEQFSGCLKQSVLDFSLCPCPVKHVLHLDHSVLGPCAPRPLCSPGDKGWIG